MSTDIIICHEDVADAFAEALRKEFADLAADKQGPFLRGVFAIRSAQRLDGFVKDALGKGAKVLAGTTEGRSHNIMQPLVLDGVTDDMRASLPPLYGA